MNWKTKKQKAKEKYHILAKAKNHEPIRVLYKKVGQPPEVKIISDVFKLKKAIVENNLEMIPYENLLLICNCQQAIQNEKTNIVLTFRSIKGDLLLVDFDKTKREFKELSQEDSLWYSKDLMKKTPPPLNFQKPFYKVTTKKLPEYHEKSFERDEDNSSTSFEKSLINVLTNIELVLACFLKNTKNGEMKNE